MFKDSVFGATQQYGGLPARYAERLETCSPADPRLMLTQVEVRQLALEYLAGTESTVELGVGLIDFDAGADGVRARTTDGEVTAQYLVAADGARSDVRTQLGVTVPDRSVVARLNTAFFRADLGRVIDEWGANACFVRNDDVYAALFSTNGRDQWSAHLMDYPGKPDELVELSEEKAVALLHKVIGEPVPVELYAVNGWEAALGIASAFRRGRVFLAGDAAHTQSLAGGLGMNTGIQDGHNLAWKLAAVLRGEPAALLDTYEPERRAAAEASLRVSRRMHEGFQTRVPDPERMYEEIAVDYLRGMMFYSYSPGDTDDTDVLTDEIRSGRRFPHRWVAPGVSTLDLVGTQGIRLTGREEWLAGLSVRGPVVVRPDGFVE